MMMFRSKAVIAALQSWNNDFPERIGQSCKIVRFLGFLRIFNDVNRTSCVFKNNLTKASLIWDYKTHSIIQEYKENWIHEFIARCDREVTEKEISEFIANYNLESEDIYSVCRGHDVLRVLSLMMQKKEYSKPKDIFMRMKDSYPIKDFKKTRLHSLIANWGESRKLQLFVN